jgi:hypothetical protein
MIRNRENLNATILVFDPTYEAQSIKPKVFRPSADWFKGRKSDRVILNVHRLAVDPLTSQVSWPCQGLGQEVPAGIDRIDLRADVGRPGSV